MTKVLALGLGIAVVIGSFVACDDDTASSPPPGTDGGIVNVDSGSSSSSSSSGAPVTQCPETTGPTEHRNNVDADETWTAAGSPHFVTSDITIKGKLTIEPCATVLLGGSKQVSVVGSLIANGEEAKPIKIGKSEDKPFARLLGSGGSIALRYVTIDGGGDPQNALPYLAGTILVQGKDNSAPTQPLLEVSHVTMNGSASNGIVLQDGAGFTEDSSDLTITGATLHPISVWARAVGTLPRGVYTGNTSDTILIPATAGNEAIQESATMKNVGVPYLIGHEGSQGTLYVAAKPGSVATLTIEPGTTLKFKKGGLLAIEPTAGANAAAGALIAKGAADKRIVFTSDAKAPAAGDWKGIWFGQVPAATNAIDYARVEFAGGDSSSGGDSCPYTALENADAAIRIFGPPSSAFVTNTEIASSAVHGIDRGYRSDQKLDFTATNTFTNIARCKQSYPKDANGGGCPAPPPCEK